MLFFIWWLCWWVVFYICTYFLVLNCEELNASYMTSFLAWRIFSLNCQGVIKMVDNNIIKGYFPHFDMPIQELLVLKKEGRSVGPEDAYLCNPFVCCLYNYRGYKKVTLWITIFYCIRVSPYSGPYASWFYNEINCFHQTVQGSKLYSQNANNIRHVTSTFAGVRGD